MELGYWVQWLCLSEKKQASKYPTVVPRTSWKMFWKAQSWKYAWQLLETRGDFRGSSRESKRDIIHRTLQGRGKARATSCKNKKSGTQNTLEPSHPATPLALGIGCCPQIEWVGAGKSLSVKTSFLSGLKEALKTTAKSIATIPSFKQWKTKHNHI